MDEVGSVASCCKEPGGETLLGQVQSQDPLVLTKENICAASRNAAVKPNILGKMNNQRYFTAVSKRSLKPRDDCIFQDCWKSYRQR